MSTTTWIVLGVIALLVIWVIILYNGLVAMRQRVNQAFADIDVQLKQRHDLVPNLVETVKGYASHERGTLEAVVQARNAAITAQAPAELAQAENMLSGALRQLFALCEAYPDLKANQNFQQLQSELADIENKLAAARRFFNNAVQEYNTGIQQFPAVLLAGPLGFTQKEFFDVGVERARARPGAAGEVLSDPASFRGAGSREPGIHTPGLWLWIPGSRFVAPRNDEHQGAPWPTGSTPTSSRTSAVRSRC